MHICLHLKKFFTENLAFCAVSIAQFIVFTNSHVASHFSEAVVWRCSVKKVFLETALISKESVCAKDSFIMAQVFSCEFAKFLRTPFFYKKHFPWLFLIFRQGDDKAWKRISTVNNQRFQKFAYITQLNYCY